jgi:hypothetical protein
MADLENFSMEGQGCVCLFISSLGNFKDILLALIDSVTIILRTVQASIALVPVDLSDQLTKIKLETELELIEMTVGVIEPPLGAASGYFKAWADCDPVASVSKTMDDLRDTVLKDVEERRYEIEQLIEALNLESQKIEKLNQWINQLEDLKDAITACGDQS